MATSYSNPGGSGLRFSIVTPTWSPTLFQSSNPYSLIDGNTTSSSAYIGGAVADLYMVFDFHFPCIIDEAKWYQSNAAEHGTWKWQGSNDGSNWTDIGSSFTLGGASTQTQTQLNGNTTAYRYYRLLGVSGTASNSPWLYEIQFQIDYNTSNLASTYTNVGGVGDRSAVINISTTMNINSGTIGTLINGAYDNGFWSNAAVSGVEIKFDFGVGVNKVINDALWYQDTADTHGNWKWQGSPNNSDWTDIGANFTLGGVLVQSQTQLNGNTSGYRYYRLLGVSGNFSSGPWIYEIDFQVGDPAVLAVWKKLSCLDNVVAKSLFDAQTVLAAVSDNTPVAITLTEQGILGRKTGGDITALTATEILTIIGAAPASDWLVNQVF
jgi:hypothetical protein